ncbi:hypothetical protein SAMN03080601_00669 [Alkalitalea saponilacus]|uniref:Uncharacterized protein n=1 Tax=Alkalitalea saponilacus TaxID=889453 RepID=A0A1T5BWU5_9BACT|nr:hypothetical protein SAMN03080601_00669 [Alkalitalea saponilacus]
MGDKVICLNFEFDVNNYFCLKTVKREQTDLPASHTKYIYKFNGSFARDG